MVGCYNGMVGYYNEKSLLKVDFEEKEGMRGLFLNYLDDND